MSTPPLPSQGPGLGKKLLFSAVACVLLLGLAELLARVAPERLTLHRDEAVRAQAGPEALFTSGRIPGWDTPPDGSNLWGSSISVNRWQMRGPKWDPAKPEGVKRLIVAGDSTPFGYGLRWEQTIVEQLSQNLSQQQPGLMVQTSNCAVPGHSTVQTLEKLRWHCLAFEPDVVVIGNQFSDSSRREQSDREIFGETNLLGRRSPLEGLASYRAMRNLYLLARVDVAGLPAAQQTPLLEKNTNDQTPFRVDPDEYEDNLRQMVTMVRDSGAQPVLMLLPTTNDLAGGAGIPKHAGFREAMRRVASDMGVPLADCVPVFNQFPKGTGLFIDTVHPSHTGAANIARVVAEAMEGMSF